MNKEYKYIDGKIVVKNDEGHEIIYDYSRNIKEILIKENLIEMIENKIKSLVESNDTSDKQSNYYKPCIAPYVTLMTVLGSPIFSFLYGNHDIFTNYINTRFGTMNEALWHSLVVSGTFLPLTLFLESLFYKEFKEKLKYKNATESEIYFLEQIKQYNKIELELLKEEQRDNVYPEDLEVVKLNNLEILYLLKDKIEKYYNFGYNLNKYINYYNNGFLEDILENENYSNEDIEIAKKYLKEKKLKKRKS